MYEGDYLKVTKISKVDTQPQGQSNEPLVMKTQTHDKSSTVFSNILNQNISNLKESNSVK